MTLYRTFLSRIGYYWVCVAPATILCGDRAPEEDSDAAPLSLREEASCNGLCFLQVLRYLPNARLYTARVAADPSKVKDQPFEIFCTEEQLADVLPWDCRLEGKSPERILAILKAHAKEGQALQQDASAPPPRLHPESIIPLTPLVEETLIVETGDLQEAIDPMAVDQCGETNHGRLVNTGPLHLCLLRALIANLMLKMLQVRYKDQTAYLALKEHLGLVVRILRWQRRSHQHVVNVFPEIAAKNGGVVWRLIVGCPDRAILAA